jgi:ribose transport system ATP-binding protein
MRLQAIGVSKNYRLTRALREARLEVEAGEIHALLGENGAGKSTLLRILSGEEQANRGRILLDDAPCAWTTPMEARRAGVFRISEERMLADDLTVEENLLLGLEPSWLGWVGHRKSRKLARSALGQLCGEPIPPHLPAGRLTCGQAQRVEIARSLLGRPKLLLLDEPTRSLSHWEIASLFETLRRLAGRGISIVFISHFLEEAQALCSRYTLLGSGETVASGQLDPGENDRWVGAISGRDHPPKSARPPKRQFGKPLLELKKMGGPAAPRRIDLTLHQGEILGLAGLDGAGRLEMLRAIFGLARLREGEIWRLGKRSRWGSPPGALRAGIAFAGGERREGIFPDLSLADNLTLASLGRFGVLGFLNLKRQSFAGWNWMEKLHIRARGPFQRAGELSRGNQQKLILARLMLRQPSVLLLDEPTRGIDPATQAQLREVVAEMAHEGKGVLWISSDPAELLEWCDTIALFRRGRLVELRPASDWSPQGIIAAALGPP